MKKIRSNEIDREITMCPYCGDEKRGSCFDCCGESSNHFVQAYVMNDGETYQVDEVLVIEVGDEEEIKEERGEKRYRDAVDREVFGDK